MIGQKQNMKWVVVSLLAIAAFPLIITAYEAIFKGGTSVVFLGNFHPKLVFIVISYYVVLLCLGIVWLVRQIIFIAKLKNEKTKAELMLLKSQVSPHFFFNMLNNLYGLVTRDAQKAQELILKLSDMMRYSIYEGEKEMVTIGEEISFLKNYIELHKMRYHKQVSVEFNYDTDESRQIAPLMFIILLENAFKHGVENMLENAYIKIKLSTSQNQLKFSIENSFQRTDNQSGIGLENLKRRLALVYPGRHELRFSETENIYQVQLILMLA